MTSSRASASPLDNIRLIGGICGIAFVILFIIGAGVQGDMVSWDDSEADIRSFFADDADKFLVGDWLIGIAIVLFLLPFFVALWRVLRSVDSSGLWSGVSIIGSVLFMGLGGASGMGIGAIAVLEGDGVDLSTMRVALAINDYGFATAGFGLAIALAAASLVIVRTGVLWRWLALLAAAAAVLLVIGVLGSVQHDSESALGGLQFIGLIGAVLFVLLTSVCMLVRARLRSTVEATAAA